MILGALCSSTHLFFFFFLIFFFLLLFHLLAKDSSSIKKIDTCIYSRKNPQKISENLLLCIRYGKTTKKLYKWVCLWFMCIIIDYCAVHDFFWVSSDLFCWNCCQLARIGSDSRYLQFTFPLYKTEYNCSINWILIYFICRNYSMSCTTYRFILYSWISKMAGESIGLELIVYSVIECKL